MTNSCEPVTQLSDDSVGRWLVITEHSTYLLDLEVSTVERVAGAPRPPAAPADTRQPLRRVVEVRVGRPAIWWMRNTSGGYVDADEIWQHTSVVVSIKPADDSEAER